LKIAFLLGSPDISGGTNVIYEHASRLQKMGHEVCLLTETVIEPDRCAWHPEAALLGWNTLDAAGDTLFDIVIATWWQSVFHLCRLRSCNYAYFVQSIESRFFPARDEGRCELRDIDIFADWCENTYRYPLTVITEASWIQNYIAERFNRQAYLAVNGIRKEVFSADGPCCAERVSGRLRVLVEGPLAVFYKNVEKTIDLCSRAGADEIWLLTSSDIAEYPGVTRCFSRVPIHSTADIYRSCDVLVKLSHVEGMFGPPLEMFHCGGTAIVYEVTGHEEYIVHGSNAIVVPKDDEDQVIDWLQRLKEDSSLLAKLKHGALETAASWPDWETASTTFATQLLGSATGRSETSAGFLEMHNRHFIEVRENAFSQRAMQRMAMRDGAGDAHRNCVQVYCDGGAGIMGELRDGYESGKWSNCRVVQEGLGNWVRIRVDPSVLIGVVAVRAIRISDNESGLVLAEWGENSTWDDIGVTGTAVCLRQSPCLVLESFGEDPQLVLPEMCLPAGSGSVAIDIEVFETGFRHVLSGGGFPYLYRREQDGPIGRGVIAKIVAQLSRLMK